jgi:AcrR family transcriptional regulator
MSIIGHAEPDRENDVRRVSDAPKGDQSNPDKVPRTARGRETLRKLLDAAAIEFGEKGFHEASISGITRRAKTALGSFYTYFDSKDEIFRALVRDMSRQVGKMAAGRMGDESRAFEREKLALLGFLEFARDHTEIYRIIDEAEFVDPESYRRHYETTAERILMRLRQGVEAGEVRSDVSEFHAWAVMGMNVFLGLRYGVLSKDHSPEVIAELAQDFLQRGLKP